MMNTYLCLFPVLTTLGTPAPPPSVPQDPFKNLQVSGYAQFRFDALQGDSSLFKAAGSGGTGQRPTLGGPHVGGPSNGFLVRRGRLKLSGPVNPQDAFTVQLDFPTTGAINLRDAFADIKSGLPRHAALRVGQFPPPFTYVLPATSRLREAPERPLGFSDSGNAALIVKDTVSSLGGEVTPGSIVPLFINQDRDQGLQLAYQGSRTHTAFGWFNGEGRDAAGQRSLNSGLTFMGRVEHQFPSPTGTAFVGVSRYNGGYSVRSAAPVGTTVAAFRSVGRSFHNIDSRWVSKKGFEVRYEHLWGTYEVTPDRALYLANNKVESWYLTARQPLDPKTVFSATYDVFCPTNKTVAGVTAGDYARKTLQGGILHQLAPGTRLRLWYVQGLSAYDPSAPKGSAARKRVGQLISELQLEF